MVTISEIISFVYPEANPLADYRLGYVDEKLSVTYWDENKLGHLPDLPDLQKHQEAAESFATERATRGTLEDRISKIEEEIK